MEENNKIAYQYKIRQEKSLTENLEFDYTKLTLKDTEIKLIDKITAKNIIIEYEWLKTIPLVTNYHFGLYFKINNKEYLGGVLIFSNDYAENTGVWKNYGFEDKILLLSRGVCLWWTPKNSASFFISKVCKWIKNNTKYRIITATVDPSAGEIGTIYQSLNWYYVGLMCGNYSNNKETKRFSVLINGKLRYSRSIRKEFGCMKKEVILEKYPDAKFINQYRKRRYFYFMNNKTKNKEYFNNIKHLILPYPKRNLKCVGIIYKIKNKINNKIYIGQTIRSLIERIEDYKNGLGNDYLNNSFKKYGFENFEFSIIDTAETIDELNQKEIYYIKLFNSTNKEIGYNQHSGGRNAIPNEETLKKMSISHKGKKQNKEWVEKRIPKAGSEEAKKHGRPKTEEQKKYLSEISPKYWQGKHRSEDTKRKVSETKKKNGISENFKKNICKKVYIKNLETNEINDFDSTRIAGEKLKLHQSTVSERCKYNMTVKGILYTYNNPK